MQPQLFLSYSRTDLVYADQLAADVRAAGCRVWLDRAELLAGDDFVRELQEQLARCDGLVVLLTRQSAQSSWVQAEVQRALALKIPVIVVQRDADAQFPDALERLLRDLHRSIWTDTQTPDISGQIHRARARRRARITRRVLGWGVATVFLVVTAVLAVWRMDAVEAAMRRSELLSRIGDASSAWSRGEVDAVIAPARTDPLLPPLLEQLASDATQSVAIRHNAWQGLTALRESREREWRLFVPDVDWAGGRIVSGLWANATYGRGKIDGLQVERSRIAGVVLGPGPDQAQAGLTLIGARIVDSDAWFLQINGTQLLDVEFLDTRFRGAQLDLSGHAGVRFLTTPADPSRLTGALTLFEDSWITQHRVLPAADVLDLAKPEQELVFDGVQFMRTRFEGQFKPQWFRNSHFQDCVFATTTLPQQALVDAGNTVETGIWTQVSEPQ